MNKTVIIIINAVFLVPLFLQAGECETHVKLQHPRLMSKDEFLKSSDNADYFLLEKSIHRLFAQPESRLIGKEEEKNNILALAIMFNMTSDKKYFYKSKSIINSLIAAEVPRDDQHIRTRLKALSYYYDVFHELLDKDEAEIIENKILMHLNLLRKFIYTKNFGGGHQFSANVTALMACIAVYYEKPEMRTMFSQIENNITSGFLPFYEYLISDGGGFHMWWGYSKNYFLNLVDLFFFWRNATGEDLFRQSDWLPQISNYFIYGLRDDKRFWSTGDKDLKRKVDWEERVISKVITKEYCDSKLLSYLLNDNGGYSIFPEENLYDLLWQLKAGKKENVPGLNLIHSFKKIGCYVFRETWNGEGVIALFKCTPTYFLNHSHKDANSFEIWYKSDLAIDSGCYDYYESSHWLNYYTRSIAHNTVLIKDPNETFEIRNTRVSNDGGQRFITIPHEQPYDVNDLTGEAFHVADSRMVVDNENYALVIGDATKAYNADKCELFQRYFLFLKRVAGWKHPVIVILDKVISKKASFDKVWLLHSINRPTLNRNVATIMNEGSKLLCWIIEPEEFDVKVVGGSGHEFEVGGVNYPIEKKRSKELDRYLGAWRIELRPKAERREVNFTTVLVPTDVKDKTVPIIEKIDHGVRVGNWNIFLYDNNVKVVQSS